MEMLSPRQQRRYHRCVRVSFEIVQYCLCLLKESADEPQVYEQYKDADDGFLYVVYSGENTFGTNV